MNTSTIDIFLAMSNANSYKGRLENFWKAASNTPRSCMQPGCTNQAIGSHLLQRKGVLDVIASKSGKIMQYGFPNHNHRVRFQERGLRQGNSEFIFYGFCNEHDGQIFKPIEYKGCLFNEYNEQVLLGYRAYLKEMYSQLVVLDFHEKILSSNHIDFALKAKFAQKRLNNIVRLKSSQFIKNLFEQEIASGFTLNTFKCFRREIAKIEIATSVAMAVGEYMVPASYEHLKRVDPLAGKFVDKIDLVSWSLIPTNNSLLFIACSYPEKARFLYQDIDSVFELQDSALLRYISDLILSGPETLFLSHDLYRDWQGKGVINKILQLKERYSQSPFPMNAQSFNIFADHSL